MRIRMEQEHYAFASEIRNLSGPFTSVHLDAGYTEHEPAEIDDGEVGTTLKNKDYEARSCATSRQHKVAALKWGCARRSD